MPDSIKHQQAIELPSRENELKIALGAEREFALWSAALGHPENVKHQLNLYLRSPQLDSFSLPNEATPLLLRLRTELPAASLLSAAGNLIERVISAPDLETACAYFSSASPSLPVFIFTLKQGLTQENGYFRSLELEADMDSRQTARILRGDLTALGSTPPGDFLREKRLEVCEFMGQLINTRCCFRRANGELWELDLSHFPKRTDCELEVETPNPDQALAEIRRLADQLGTPIRAQNKTKLQRFLESLI
ncbi:MAG: hypothetical protein Q4F00_08680 [bacterium]|nr:hypothetical protein [bacterium]